MNYRLYQIKDTRSCGYAFWGYDWASAHGFSKEDYALAYEGSVPEAEPDVALEVLYRTFNSSTRPSDFKGRSMSVSDVVVLNGKAYYCDHVGFTEVEGWED